MPAYMTAGGRMKMIEPEHIDELVRLTKSGALTWRKTPEGVTEG